MNNKNNNMERRTEHSNELNRTERQQRRTYERPSIVYEVEVEVVAGYPLGTPPTE